MRFFNTAGPVEPAIHYAIPPLSRLDLDELLSLVRQKKYFVLHAPYQSGKTTTLLALRDLLNAGSAGDFRCVYASLEVGRAGGEDIARAMQAILAEIGEEALLLGDGFPGAASAEILRTAGPDAALSTLLTRWCGADPRPLVLLLDEVDALVGDTLVSVLRQLRTGYARRLKAFPHSVVLCGLQDVRDYRFRPASNREVAPGGPPFNIRAEALRLGDFDEAEIRALLAQHTAETGQRFTPEAVETVGKQTQGQPWLVNALAYEACFRDRAGRDRIRTITADAILTAGQALILRRETHIARLGEKLREERVRRVIEPMLTGGDSRADSRDFQYVRDLGLIAPDPPTRIANPIYREVVPRELTWMIQADLDLGIPSPAARRRSLH